MCVFVFVSFPPDNYAESRIMGLYLKRDWINCPMEHSWGHRYQVTESMTAPAKRPALSMCSRFKEYSFSIIYDLFSSLSVENIF